MTKSEQFAKRINNQIKKLQQEKSTLLIAIDGYSGAGKTTILKNLVKLNKDILAVHLDDFLLPGLKRKGMLAQAVTNKDKIRIYQHKWYHYKDIEELLKEFLAKRSHVYKYDVFDYDHKKFIPTKFDLKKRILVIEGIFLLHPQNKLSNLWDLGVYIDSHLGKADKRRVVREKKRWGPKYVPEDHPDSHVRIFKLAYRDYIKKMKSETKADLVLKR